MHFQITLIPFYVLEMTHLRSIFVIRKDGFCTYAQFLHVLGSAQQNSIHVSRAHVAPCRHFDALNQDGFSLTKFALLESHFLLLHIFFTFLDDDDRNVLESYVQGFSDRINELDSIMLQQQRNQQSEATDSSNDGNSGTSPPIPGRKGSSVIGLVGGLVQNDNSS